VDYYNMTGGYIEWNATSARGRQVTLAIRYANASPSPRQVNITVNGVTVAAKVDFPPTPNWDTWLTRTVTIPLPRGTATIRMTATTTAGGPNVDYCDLT
jgi:hypothetical protein